jgi:hypothetical protein
MSDYDYAAHVVDEDEPAQKGLIGTAADSIESWGQSIMNPEAPRAVEGGIPELPPGMEIIDNDTYQQMHMSPSELAAIPDHTTVEDAIAEKNND